MPVRLVPVDRASQGAIPVYESSYTGSVPVVQRQDNPGAVPVYIGPRGLGMPVNFGNAVPDIPITPPEEVSTYLRPGGVDTYLRPDGTSSYIRP